MSDRLVVRGAREHNLQSVNIDLPREKLIVFTGLSGSGKSTLAQRLADRSLLWLPVVSHDAIRSGLRRPIGSADDRGARVPVEASIGLFYATIEHYLRAGASVIAELSWRRGISEADLAEVAQLARPVNVHCQASVDVAHRRFLERERALHPGVDPAEGAAAHIVRQMAGGEFPWDLFDPLDLDMPRITVDTTDGYRPGLDEVARFCWEIAAV
jgi:predicted kinase